MYVRICLYVSIAGQTAGHNWQTFFEGTPGYSMGNIGSKNLFFFLAKIVLYFFSKFEISFKPLTDHQGQRTQCLSFSKLSKKCVKGNNTVRQQYK